ncbi:MAG: type IV pilus twitching motility protein PilT [Acidobacteria bacterium]|nr:MAG: type IV pilus twitching motility protein PilT [Acidobacteriota bacterium]
MEREHLDEHFQVEFTRPSGSIQVTIRRTVSVGGAAPPSTAPAPSKPSPPRATPAAAPSPKADTAAAPSSEAPAAKPSQQAPAAAPALQAPAAAPSTPTVAAPTQPAAESAKQPSGREAMDELLRFMVGASASDLHLSSNSCPVLRVHGEVQFLSDRGVLDSDTVKNLVFSILDDDVRATFEEHRDADCAYEIPGLSRFRVNVFEDRHGIGTVIRTIPVEILTAEQLGLPPAILELCFLTKGLVLVTGPTGSGKSTTLAAMVDHINKNRADHIITIEDPIEFVHQNNKCLINQRQVGNHTGSFKAALRAALREDPDIVLVGELRDLETIAIAIETAETGHLVFGTLHTSTAMATVDRIIDQFPADQQEQIRTMIAGSLKGVIAQVLCKKKEGGRAAALEILLGTSALASLIRDGKTYQIPSIMQTSKAQGMVTMNDALMKLVKTGKVEPKEAWMKATDKTGLVGLFKSNGIKADFLQK